MRNWASQACRISGCHDQTCFSPSKGFRTSAQGSWICGRSGTLWSSSHAKDSLLVIRRRPASRLQPGSLVAGQNQFFLGNAPRILGRRFYRPWLHGHRAGFWASRRFLGRCSRTGQVHSAFRIAASAATYCRLTPRREQPPRKLINLVGSELLSIPAQVRYNSCLLR